MEISSNGRKYFRILETSTQESKLIIIESQEPLYSQEALSQNVPM